MVFCNVGIDSGDTIHVREAGDCGGLGTQHGRLYIKIQVANDPVFRRDGADVHVDKKISFTQVNSFCSPSILILSIWTFESNAISHCWPQEPLYDPISVESNAISQTINDVKFFPFVWFMYHNL